MLQTGETYTDPGGDFFARRDPERTRKRLVNQLERLGYAVTVQEGGAATSACFLYRSSGAAGSGQIAPWRERCGVAAPLSRAENSFDASCPPAGWDGAE